MNGKGSKRRPMHVSEKEFAENWERAFKKKHKKNNDPRNHKRPQSTSRTS